MRFDAPQYLSWIPIVGLLLVLLFVWSRRRRARRLARLGNLATITRLLNGWSPGRHALRFGLITAGILTLLFAMARPQYGAMERPLRRRGVEVLIAVDCSTSMLAQDFQPSRMARARELLRDIVYRLDGDAVGILAFAGLPIVQCPITTDYDMVLNLLEAIDTDTVPVQGTAIGDVIRKATETFSTASKGYRILVLLTDGEDHESKVLDAAREASNAGVRIYAIGIGSTRGVPIQLRDGSFKEFDGSKVNSRLDFETLRQIALETGGMAIRANATGRQEGQAIGEALHALKAQELETRSVVTHQERFQYFLVVALALLILEMLISERARQRQIENLPKQPTGLPRNGLERGAL